MRGFLRLIAFIVPVLLAVPASAADYPNRTVKLIVPFGAGGPADIYARILAQHLAEATNKTFAVDEHPRPRPPNATPGERANAGRPPPVAAGGATRWSQDDHCYCLHGANTP